MMLTISKERYLEAGQMFDWATQEHYKLWFTGRLERHRRTEQILPRLVRYGRMVSAHYGKRLIYAVASKKNLLIPHGLGVTETIVRICRSQSGGDFIQEKFFRGFGSVPDWAINYNGELLLVEFSTKDNFEDPRVIKTKMTSYQKNLEKITEHFKTKGAFVLFVIDVSRERVKNFIQRNPFDDPYLFTDFETFKSVTFGQQLTTAIYFWGDGESHPLIT